MSEQPITAAHVKYLREITGCGMMEAKKALVACNGDSLLAEGYLKYMGCAINVYPREGETREQAYMRWVWGMAEGYKRRLVEGHLPV